MFIDKLSTINTGYQHRESETRWLHTYEIKWKITLNVMKPTRNQTSIPFTESSCIMFYFSRVQTNTNNNNNIPCIILKFGPELNLSASSLHMGSLGKIARPSDQRKGNVSMNQELKPISHGLGNSIGQNWINVKQLKFLNRAEIFRCQEIYCSLSI